MLLAFTILIGLRGAFAVSVDITVIQPDYCGQSVGLLYANAYGGTEPYRYEWVRDVYGTPTTICTDCGPERQDLIGGIYYKVIVTDDLGATAETVDFVAAVTLEIDYSMTIFPYLAGELPYLKVVRSPYFLQHTNTYVDVQVTGADQYGILDPPPQELWWFRPNAGSGMVEITYTYIGGQCTVQAPYVVPPPTVIPEMNVLDIQGSCANAATGSLTVALNNGSVPEWLFVWIEGPSYFTGQWQQMVQVYDGTTTFTLSGLPPGSNTVHLSGSSISASPLDQGFPYLCHASIPYTIPNLGPTCSRVQGRVFIDSNLNCTSQGSEVGVPNVVLEVQPGDVFSNTDENGNYDLVLPNGNYTVALQSNVTEEHCTMAPVPFTVTGSSTLTVNLPSLSLVALDAEVGLSGAAARPGFEYHVSALLSNLTPAPSGAVTLSMTFDPVLGFLNATPTPTSVSGNTLTWNQAQLTPFQQRTISVRFQVPPDVGLIGTDLNTTVSLATTIVDGNLTNNTATLTRTVTGSFDPNDKLATTSSGIGDGTYLLDQDEWIDYTIRFQNTGTDTAFHVIITDTLPSTLDPASIRIGAGSHPFTWKLRADGTLKFWLLNILLPDSNVNEPLSHGFVSFRIEPNVPVLPGTTIENTANIFFDFNPPVITEPAVLTVTSPGVVVSPKVMLGGPYVQATQLMSDALRSGGLIPLSEPYTAQGYSHVNGGGGETTSAAALAATGNNAIVDWVVVELRSTTAPYGVLATRCALVQRDGDVVATSGSGPVMLFAPPGNYRVAIRHRNHLGTMTNTARSLSTATTTVDFSVSTTATYGTNAQATVGTRRVLWAGDCRSDGDLKYTGTNNDRDLILQRVGGVIPTNTLVGYYRDDVNMDGLVKYTGTGNDRDRLLQNIGGTVPTNILMQQLP